MSLNAKREMDPRTVARNIVGLSEAIFPGIVPGVVAHLNRRYSRKLLECREVDEEEVRRCSLQRAMLFEIAVVMAEMRNWEPERYSWEVGVNRAAERQQQFYDAEIPVKLGDRERKVAAAVGDNLCLMLGQLESERGKRVTVAPEVPGYGWISNAVGDYSIGNALIEVKCSGKNFGSADYRQVALYWLLGYVREIEQGVNGWKEAILLNPRRNAIIEIKFGEIMNLISGGRSSLEVVQSFGAFFSKALGQEEATR